MLGLIASMGFIAAPAARAADPVVVSSVDFDDSTTGTWHQSGSPTLTYVDDGAGGMALSILRTADYEGIESPTGLLQPGVGYTFSMRARLPEGSAGTTDVRFVVKPNFNWVANTTISGSGWTTISGTYTLPDGVDPAAASVYIGSTDQAAAYTILVDDILITAPAVAPPGEIVISTDFEAGLDGWVPRGDADGDPTVSLTTDEFHSPTQAALVSDRTSQGDGIGHDVTGLMNPGTTYIITAWAKFAAGSPTDALWLSMRRTTGGTDAFDTVGQFTAVSGSDWTQVSATYQMGAAESAFLYFESRYPDGTTAPFLVDDITVETQAVPVIQELTPLKDTTDFRVGVAIDSRETTGAPAELLLRHFDGITPENHMKPEAWYDPDRTFRIHPEAQALMDFAQANGTVVYGHTLVWHSQTPAWFFEHDDGSPLTSSDADQAISAPGSATTSSMWPRR
jgi:endo-1,4-beta-xylanase